MSLKFRTLNFLSKVTLLLWIGKYLNGNKTSLFFNLNFIWEFETTTFSHLSGEMLHSQNWKTKEMER